MSLVKSSSKKAMSTNIGKEMAAGKPKKQAVAIAYSVRRQSTAGKDLAGRFHKTKLGY